MKKTGNLMYEKFSQWPLRWKIVSLILGVTALGILLSMLGFYYSVHNILKKSAVRDLTILSEIVGNSSRAALEFEDQKKASELLKEAGANPDITEAALYDKSGNLFASYSRSGLPTVHEHVAIAAKTEYQSHHIKVIRSITLHGEIVGGVLLLSNNESYQAQRSLLAWICIGIFLIILASVIFLALKVQSWMTRPIVSLVEVTKRISQGDLNSRSPIRGRDEIGQLAASFNKMVANLKDVHDSLEFQNHVKSEVAQHIKKYQNMTDLAQLTQAAVSDIAKLTGAGHGAFYLVERSAEDKTLVLWGSYAFKERKKVSNTYQPGEGIVGQCALEKEPILLTRVPSDYIRITSGVGEKEPLSILAQPVIYNKEVTGVLELANFSGFPPEKREIINEISSTLGILINNIQDRIKTNELLEESQRLTEELQSQQEELKTSNEELEEQTGRLRNSEERLKIQSEELQVNNEELEEKTKLLQKQKSVLEKTTADIQKAKDELEKRAREIQRASRYKSEFLANMSHELRTPLNSLLILAKMLADNEEENLMPDQVESAKVIYNSGKDLLNLINDILDLSKVEAGKLHLTARAVRPSHLMKNMKAVFTPVAKEKKLAFEVIEEPGLPDVIHTDPDRTEQILKNLLSNAFKFTDKGKVVLRAAFRPSPPSWVQMPAKGPVVVFSIEDTGIGILKNREAEIFQAFQQLDGSISRKYGGTGLGLTISRELGKLLGASIHLKSAKGKGSTFTLWMPVDGVRSIPETETPPEDTQEAPRPAEPLKSDNAVESRPVILLIEDDNHFANTLRKLIEARGYKLEHVRGGKEGLSLAAKLRPLGIILDLGLPDMEGLEVLDSLKRSPETTNIPVHVISGRDESHKALEKGALGYLIKPIEEQDLENIFRKFEHSSKKKIHELLLVEDDGKNRLAVSNWLKEKNVRITAVATGREALQAAETRDFEGVILDLGLPDMSGFELIKELKKIKKGKSPSLIVYTGKSISKEEYQELRQHTSRIVIKGSHSPERLKMEVGAFLNRVTNGRREEESPEENVSFEPGKLLTGKKILLVDDDLRNNFALSKVLEKQGMQVILADNGELGVKRLLEEKDVDLVLMDIMMPVMDGYEAIQKIRSRPEYQKLPVLALTAKAMQEDRKRALEAGANDYLTKPVDTSKLINIIRLWVFR